MADYKKNLGKVCITADGAWNSLIDYDRLCLVTITYNDNKTESYISRKGVPAGIAPVRGTSSEYWQLFANGFTIEDLTIGEDGTVYIGGQPTEFKIGINDALSEVVLDALTERLADAIGVKIDQIIGSKLQTLISGGLNLVHSGHVELEPVGDVDVDVENNCNCSGGGSGGDSGDGGDSGGGGSDTTTKCKITVVTNPSDATVSFNGTVSSTKEIEVDKGSDTVISVSAEGYNTKQQTVSDIQEDTTVTITLEEDTTDPNPDYRFDANSISSTWRYHPSTGEYSQGQGGGGTIGTGQSSTTDNIYSEHNGQLVDFDIDIVEGSEYGTVTREVSGNKYVLKFDWTNASETENNQQISAIITQNVTGKWMRFTYKRNTVAAS